MQHPVQHQVPCRFRPLPAEEGQKKDIRVPERIPLIAAMGQPACTDGNVRVIPCIAAEHLKDVPAQCALDVRIRVQHNIAVPPERFPCHAVRLPGILRLRPGWFLIQQHAHPLFNPHRAAGLQGKTQRTP